MTEALALSVDPSILITNLLGTVCRDEELEEPKVYKSRLRSKRRSAVFFSRARIPPYQGVNSRMGKQICVIPFRRGLFLIKYTRLAPTRLNRQIMNMMRI